ncbi:hypothetical protein ILUMI_18080 [Ignelater luminosus]|uniref:Uncharacterized protein n=1 Tax=Ignelater luminosus TaxID=2038154 RepID=A0A8K0CPB0_IGNLU|nr:hypothetical protein ILUMI_18080 [Ignelater luminosus]
MGSKLCKLFEADVAGIQRFARCGNFSQCVYLKNKTYRGCNFVVDESKLPPRMPTGRYLADVEVTYESINLFVLKVYFMVSRPEVKK